MTTSVIVKTRGFGAQVSTDGESIEMGANQERKFDTDSILNIVVTQNVEEDPAPAIPGAAENDALIKEVSAETLENLDTPTPDSRKTRRFQ